MRVYQVILNIESKLAVDCSETGIPLQHKLYDSLVNLTVFKWRITGALVFLEGVIGE